MTIDTPDFTIHKYEYSVSREAPPLRLRDLWPAMNLAPQPDSQYSSELDAAESTLRDFATLGPDWDGDGALSINPTVISNATAIARALGSAFPMPDINPNPNGTISFEWESGSGIAHLEMGKTRFSFYARP